MARTTFNHRAARRIAERSDVRVKDLVDKTGYSQPHISNVMGGNRPPTWEMVKKIAAALGCEPMDLVGDPAADLEVNGAPGAAA
jgi:transcriptional regulator with XRE-family HTH domain